jgi:uncharacterized protein with FMN-binding domain
MKRKTLLYSLGLLSALFFVGCDMVNSTSNNSSSKVTSSNTTSSMNTSSMNTSPAVYEYFGEYQEESYGQTYITKVKVNVDNGVIKKVEILEGSNLYTDSSSWPGNTAWTSKEAEVLKSYEGKTIEEINNSTNIVVDNVAGASLTSNRLYQAVKNALKGMN